MQSLRAKKEEPMIMQAPIKAQRIISTIVESDSQEPMSVQNKNGMELKGLERSPT